MPISDVTKYLKFANVQMAAESLFGLSAPQNIGVGAPAYAGSNTKTPRVRVKLFCAVPT